MILVLKKGIYFTLLLMVQSCFGAQFQQASAKVTQLEVEKGSGQEPISLEVSARALEFSSKLISKYSVLIARQELGTDSKKITSMFIHPYIMLDKVKALLSSRGQQDDVQLLRQLSLTDQAFCMG